MPEIYILQLVVHRKYEIFKLHISDNVSMQNFIFI